MPPASANHARVRFDGYEEGFMARERTSDLVRARLRHPTKLGLEGTLESYEPVGLVSTRASGPA